MSVDFSERLFVPEAIDGPIGEPKRLQRTYRHLAIINRTLSRMDGLLRQEIVAHARVRGKSASVLEVGCGGGDVLAQLARLSRAAKLNLQLVGIDRDPRAIDYARRHFGDDPTLQFVVGDLDHVGGTFDYVFCNHVLHHLHPIDVAPFLRRLSQLKRRRLIINDLERSPQAYVLFTVAAGLFFHRSFLFADGRLSIRKGFRRLELERVCQDAGLGPFKVRRLFPWRLVITEDLRRCP